MGNETNRKDAILCRAQGLFARRGHGGVGLAQVAEATVPRLMHGILS